MNSINTFIEFLNQERHFYFFGFVVCIILGLIGYIYIKNQRRADRAYDFITKELGLPPEVESSRWGSKVKAGTDPTENKKTINKKMTSDCSTQEKGKSDEEHFSRKTGIGDPPLEEIKS
ncbi:hypothetical protein Drorol1_Dr00028290, partial [Drosera rotundifolia]